MASFEKIIANDSKARNALNTSCDNRKRWKSAWEQCTGRSFNKCSFYGCGNDAEVGGHLEVKGRNNSDYHYIAPICYSCNNSDSDNYLHMKQNVAYMKIPINSCVYN